MIFCVWAQTWNDQKLYVRSVQKWGREIHIPPLVIVVPSALPWESIYLYSNTGMVRQAGAGAQDRPAIGTGAQVQLQGLAGNIFILVLGGMFLKIDPGIAENGS